MNISGIEWLYGPDGSKGLTCNPSAGCSRVSPGCGGGYIRGPNGEQGGCWAEHLVSTRMSKNPNLPMYADLARDGGGWSGKVRLFPERLKDIVALGRRKKGARVFICDMTDLFHEAVQFEYIAAVFGAMDRARNHLFYVLTKRPGRALEWAQDLESYSEYESPAELCALQLYRLGGVGEPARADTWAIPGSTVPFSGEWAWPLPNVAFGVTCEDPRYGVPRLDLARQFPARWRWVSVEPQLADLGEVDWRGFDLLVNGGEAGSDSRPFDLAWARKVRDQAKRDGARYFFKQAGNHVVETIKPGGDGQPLDGVFYSRKDLGKKGNDLSRIPEDLRIRENLPMPGAI